MVKKEQIKQWKRKAVISIVAAVVALAALAAVLVYFAVRDDTSVTTGSPKSGETITVQGEYVCLPKGDGPQTLECAFGLNVDGTYYGLDFTRMRDNPPAWTQLQMGDQIRVTGTYNERRTIYQSPGVITVKTAQEL